jgi:hypothetical protein
MRLHQVSRTLWVPKLIQADADKNNWLTVTVTATDDGGRCGAGRCRIPPGGPLAAVR